MTDLELLDADDAGELSLYFDTAPGELADLEIAAAAAIQWAQGLKAAAAAVDPDCDYRVSLVAARPGSSNWIAKIERSAPNQAAQRVVRGWKKVPLVMRLGIGLAVAVPTTIVPTLEWWLGDGGFSEKEKEQLREIYTEASKDAEVEAHRKAMFKSVQRDRNITGIGTGVPVGLNWKPPSLIPASQFPQADGLFELETQPNERTISQTLDVVLVTPRLENAPRAWTFRQEGIPGSFNAIMKDTAFLAALEKSAVRETLRVNIPMRVRLSIRQQNVDGEWKVTRQGRSVIEVLSPKVE